MTKKTMVLEHLNVFNKDANELLAVDVKINEEDKMLILLSSLLESYDNIVATMLYGKNLLSYKRSCQLPYLIRSEKTKSS